MQLKYIKEILYITLILTFLFFPIKLSIAQESLSKNKIMIGVQIRDSKGNPISKLRIKFFKKYNERFGNSVNTNDYGLATIEIPSSLMNNSWSFIIVSDKYLNPEDCTINPSIGRIKYITLRESTKNRPIKRPDFFYFFVCDKNSGIAINDGSIKIENKKKKNTRRQVKIQNGWAKFLYEKSFSAEQVQYTINAKGYKEVRDSLKLDLILNQTENIIELEPKESKQPPPTKLVLKSINSNKKFFNIAFSITDFTTGKGLKNANITIGFVGEKKVNYVTNHKGWYNKGIPTKYSSRFIEFIVSKRGYRTLDPMYYKIITENRAKMIPITMKKTNFYGVVKSNNNFLLSSLISISSATFYYYYSKKAEDFKSIYSSLPYGSQRFENVWQQYERNKLYSDVTLSISITTAAWLLFSLIY